VNTNFTGFGRETLWKMGAWKPKRCWDNIKMDLIILQRLIDEN
jgi:hypothetical protein